MDGWLVSSQSVIPLISQWISLWATTCVTSQGGIGSPLVDVTQVFSLLSVNGLRHVQMLEGVKYMTLNDVVDWRNSCPRGCITGVDNTTQSQKNRNPEPLGSLARVWSIQERSFDGIMERLVARWGSVNLHFLNASPFVT